MARTLDMQFMRYMNLLGKVSGVRARHCFAYNNMVVFVVPDRDIGQAIGPNNSNLRKLSSILLKRIRVVGQPRGKTFRDIENFIITIISPVKFNSISISNDEVTLSADMEGRARLIGRGRIRQEELSEILKQYFDIKKVNII